MGGVVIPTLLRSWGPFTSLRFVPNPGNFVTGPNTLDHTSHKQKKTRWVIFYLWRRWRGSNPRYGCPYTRFRVARIQPALPHLQTHTLYIYETEKSNIKLVIFWLLVDKNVL